MALAAPCAWEGEEVWGMPEMEPPVLVLGPAPAPPPAKAPAAALEASELRTTKLVKQSRRTRADKKQQADKEQQQDKKEEGKKEEKDKKEQGKNGEKKEDAKKEKKAGAKAPAPAPGPAAAAAELPPNPWGLDPATVFIWVPTGNDTAEGCAAAPLGALPADFLDGGVEGVQGAADDEGTCAALAAAEEAMADAAA